MKNLEESWKRGRPDITHFALMEALATPLFINDKLDVFVHTYGDKVISVAEGLRIPKSYFRFEGVIASLFRDGVVKSDDGKVLLEVQDGTLEELVHDIEPDTVLGEGEQEDRRDAHRVEKPGDRPPEEIPLLVARVEDPAERGERCDHDRLHTGGVPLDGRWLHV